MKKTENKGSVLIYDICQVPDGITITQITDIVKNHQICFYDASRGKGKPRIISSGKEKYNWLSGIKFIKIKNKKDIKKHIK